MPEPTIEVNNTDYVSTGKGVAGGYYLVVEKPSTAAALDTLIASLLSSSDRPTGAVNLGYITSDGVTESISKSSTVETDMNGDPIITTGSDRTETWRMRFAEVKRKAVLELMYGAGNVSESSGKIVAWHSNVDLPEMVHILDLVLKDGSRARRCMPQGQLTELGDLSINSTSILGRETTVSGNLYTSQDGTMSGTAFEVYWPAPSSDG